MVMLAPNIHAQHTYVLVYDWTVANGQQQRQVANGSHPLQINVASSWINVRSIHIYIYVHIHQMALCLWLLVLVVLLLLLTISEHHPPLKAENRFPDFQSGVVSARERFCWTEHIQIQSTENKEHIKVICETIQSSNEYELHKVN